MVETRSGKMQDPAQERIQAEESAKPQPGATIGRDASSDPVVLNPNIDIPKYDGTEDPRPWIESLEEIGFLYHWADYIISRYAAMNMTGSAKTWLNLHKASFTSWENIKIRLIQDFSLDANKEELRMKLNRMQHWNEPAIRFAEDILVLCNKVDPAMEEETKIEHVIGGLKKEYSFALYLNPPKTTDDLLVVCKKMDYFEKKYRERVEKSRNLYNGPRYSRPQQQSRYVPPTAARNYQTTSRPQAPVSNNYKNDPPPTPRQYRNNFPQPSTPRRPYNPNFVPKPNLQRNTYNKSQEVSKNRTEDGRPICFKCNKPGHVARYCRVKFIRILEEDPADTQEKVEEKCQMNETSEKSGPRLYADIGTFEALVDTGADLSVVDLRTALDTGHGISKLAKICAGPDGKKLDMVGSIFLNIKIDDETLSHNFVILKTHLRTLILGRDFLKKMNAKIDCKQETIKYDLTNNHDEINFEMLKIKSAKDSIVPECSMKLIKALVETEDGEYIIEESSKMFQTNGLRLARSLINIINRETHIWITNPYPRPLKIMKNQILAFGSSPAKINVSREREVEKNEEPRFQINENLSPKEQKELKQVLERYGDLFSSRLGRTNLAKHRIDTEDAKPIKHKPYRVSAKERDIIKEQIDEMLTEGIIRPSSSPWSFPVILVKKRDGKYRFCVDYRKLNNVTVKDVYPIPRIDEVMDTLQGSTHFSAIDLRSGYWQVEVEERDKEKTAFTTAHGLYEFNVMPFGLCNAPATFERNMENMLGNLRWQICLCYLDDVIIYSPDFPTHLKRLEAVFRCFRESNLRLNDKKCRFAFEELEILGYITSKHGIKPAEHNIKAVRNFPRPKKVKEVQSFLGMCSYYRKFIKDFSKIADPLTNLIKKSVSFTWTERQEEAFQTLKTALLSPPILGHFNPNAPTYVHTDASNIGIGATLVQDIGGEEKVISYLSRTLSKAEQNYSTTEKECLAVVWSMSKLRPYLYGRHFKIVTDHHALCWLKNLKDPTGRLARWALKIQEYDFDIIHKSGKKHLDADGLSRGPLPETDWDEDFERLFLNQITDEEDKFIESVKKNLNGSRRSIAQNFKEEDGCLFKKNPNPEGRAWLLVVPENKKREIMKEYHNHMSNGHLGVARTMYRIKSKYFWPSMLKDVSEFVKTCHLCQSRKGSNQLPSGLLQPIPPANFPFERIGIDFVGPLPSSKNRKKWIIVLSDYYTRYAETRAVSEATVKEVSKFLVEDIFLRHGAPQYLISDRGSQFTSNLMKEVMKTCKIKHCFTTSYHPQTNGLTERLNRTLINMLSMYVNTDQKNWDEILPFITHAYNTTIQETTGYSPFFLMFGREPTSLLDDRNISVDIDKDDYDEYIKHHLDKINRTRKLVINNTIKTQERMKKNYDKKHMERSYEPGELVAVWTPIRKIGKFAFHFQTPSRVLIIPNCMLQLPLKRLRFNQISPFASNNKKFRNDIATERLSRQDKNIMELNQDPIGVKSDDPTETTTEGRQEVRETGETTAPLADAVNQLSTLLSRVKISDGSEATISLFDGTYSATQFFQTFDRKMEDASMGEQEKLLCLPNYLARQPLELFRKLRLADRSYFQVRQILLDLYPESSEASFAKYFAMKLTGQANLETYYREKNRHGIATRTSTRGDPRDTDRRTAIQRPAPSPRSASREPRRVVPTCTADPRAQCTDNATPRRSTTHNVGSVPQHTPTPRCMECTSSAVQLQVLRRETLAQRMPTSTSPDDPRKSPDSANGPKITSSDSTTTKSSQRHPSRAALSRLRLTIDFNKCTIFQLGAPLSTLSYHFNHVSNVCTYWQCQAMSQKIFPASQLSAYDNHCVHSLKKTHLSTCPFFTKANCLFYMPSNNQTTTTSTYEPVQNAPTQRDNSHTKNIGDHTPLHNSHMTNPHNELDTHTNTQQNPLPHAYYNTTPNTHYTPQFTTLLQRYTHIFSQDKFNVPCLRIPPVKIPTNSEKIITIRPYRVPICDQQEIRNQIQQMLENGIIEQSFSPFSSPVTLVTKRDKTKRFCIDYRKVNELISSDVHPLPRIEDILDRLAQAKYFSTTDISSAYWQVPIHPDSRPLLAFATFEGLYQPTRLPFGLKTSPQIYERAISQVLQRHGLDCVAHYFDDFIIYSNTLEEHQNHLRQFFAFCEAEKLQLNFVKCEFFKQSIDFLGYTITAGTITPLTRNTDIIHAIKQPHNRKTLQSFLGAVNVYNKFIPEYARLRAPLNNLLKKDVVWNWNEACQEAFIDLKGNLTQHPILHLYKEGLPCQVYCDASTLGIAGILKQVHPDGNVYPAQYFSRTLRPHEKNYSISELECLAIVESVEKFRIYLMGRKFTIFSDHHALQWLKTIKNPSGRLFRWSLRLSSYEYEVRYIKGKLQYEADLLSRNPFCGFLDATLIKTHQPPPSKESTLTIDRNGLHTVSRKGVTKIILPKPLIQQLLQTVHTQYNHPGISQMSRIISTQYYWQGMSKDIKQKVKTCPTCQLTKRPVGPTYGELSQPPESKEPFDLLSLDTIAGFAKYGNTKIYLHVVVDHFSRYAWAFPSKSTSTTTYQQVLKRVFQDGSPKRLLTDRAPAFTSPKFRSFLLNRNIHPLITTSNNPQANGLCERLNATLTGKLRLLHLENPKVAWTKLVKKVTLIYNKTPHSTTGFPPIYLMFGILPPEISNHNTPYPDIDKARKIARTRTQNKHLQDKNIYDQRHKQPHFEVGDLVLVKLYHHPNTGKLAPYFTGPHTILEIISPNVVRIDRPNQPLQRDTDTIHVNKLKLYTEKIRYISPPAVSTYHIKHNPNYTFPFKHLTPELFPTESLRFKPTSSEPFRHLDPAIFATRRFASLFPDVKNCKPDNQLNHITPLPKDIKQENCEPTNHSNSTINKVQANISESPVTKIWTNMGQYPIFHLIFILCLLVLPYNSVRRSRRLQGLEPQENIAMIKQETQKKMGEYHFQPFRNPSIFTGERNQNPEKWLKEFHRVARYNCWDDSMCLANVYFFLQGTAHRWYENVEEKINSWDIFVKMFSQNFGHHVTQKDQLAENLKTRAQGKEETSDSYIQDVLHLCREVNPAMMENEIVAHLTKGISEEIYQSIIILDIASIDEFIKWCRKIEASNKKRVNKRVVFDRLPNVAAIDSADSESMEDLIRRIVREEVHRALNPESTTPEPSSLKEIIREEIEKNVASISKPIQRPPPRQSYPNQTRTFSQVPRRQYPTQTPIYNQTPPQRRTDEWRTHDNIPICFNCGRPGHVKRYCRERRQWMQRPKGHAPSTQEPQIVISDGLRRQLKKTMFKDSGMTLKVADGKNVSSIGRCTISLSINGLEQPLEFIVLPNSNPSIILVWDFLEASNAVIDCGRAEIRLEEAKDVLNSPASIGKVVASRSVVIPAESTKLINVMSEELNGQNQVLFEPSKKVLIGKGLTLPCALFRLSHNKGKLWIVNFSTTAQIVPKGMCLGKIQRVEENNLTAISECSEFNKEVKNANHASHADKSDFKFLQNLISDDLSEEQQSQILSILKRYEKIFDKNNEPVKQTSVTKHKIETGNHQPIKHRPYRVSPTELKKKDGNWRFCVDYRRLNKVTKKDVYPLPRIDDTLDSLKGAKFYSSMDLHSGYWQIEVDEADREKTAFITPDGLYEFLVMPFGLCNAPATFERMMDKILKGLKWTMALCYLDDIVVYSKSFNEHLHRLEIILQCLDKAELRLNPKKCLFGTKRIRVFGHLVDSKGIYPDPEKIEAIAKFPTPKSITDVRSFIGLCSYYRRFIENFAEKAAPLHEVFKKDNKFTWNSDQQDAFDSLKKALMSEPVLAYFEEQLPTELHTDASGYGIGAVLVQINDGKERPVGYASRTLFKAEKNYSTTERECLAAIWAINKFRPYLFGREFVIVTDHHALCWLSNLKDPTGRLARWALKLQEYNVTVVYKSGRKHQDADCLSRNPLQLESEEAYNDEDDDIPSITALTCFEAEQRKDPKINELIDETEIFGAESKGYEMLKGTLYKKNFDPLGNQHLLVIPKHLRLELLKSLHDAPTAGHLGFSKTYERAKNKYFWPGLLRDIRKYVAHCKECQRKKQSTQKPPGLLKAIPPASSPFQRVGMDLLGRFPKSDTGNKWIIVCTDYLTRFAVTKALPTGEAKEAAKFLMEDVVLKHGAPREIITDRGRVFQSKLIAELTNQCSSIHRFTTAYHPQTNGLTERLNKTLANMIAMYVSVEQKDWDVILPYVTFAYNTAKQDTTGFTPFKLIHGREAETTVDTLFPNPHEDLQEDYSQKIASRVEETRQLARLETLKAQEKDKARYDSKHEAMDYNVGDLVWIFIPIRKVGLSEKLMKRYFGPYRVTRKLSDVTFEVEPVDQPTRRRQTRDLVHGHEIMPKLHDTTRTFFAYGQDRPLPCYGYFNAVISWKENSVSEEIYVIDKKVESLLGGKASFELGIIKRVNHVNESMSTNIETLVQEHEHLFHGLGTIKGYSHKVTLKDNYRPIAQRCRRIHYAMVEAVNQELDKMLENGIIEEVHQGSEWVSNIIVVPKRDSEKIRLCIDLREVNKAILRERHPIPTIDNMLHALKGAKVFAKLDAKKKGFGSAPEAYQKGMDSILLDLKGVICYLDDVVVYAKDRQELEERLRKVLQRFDKVGIRLNRNKCKFAMEELDILGHIVSSEGIKPDNRKIEAVLNFPIPKNIEMLRNQPLINDQPLQIVPLPSKPWMKLGIDIVGPIGHHYVLTVIDYYSSYPEAMIIEDISSKTIIKKLMEIFARHGYPHEVVTYNGLQFVSTSMERFLKECGIRHIKASPYYPKSNGKIERFHRFLKKQFNSSSEEGKDWKEDLSRILMSYRTTPNRSTGKTPAFLLFSREIKTKLSSLVNDTEENESNIKEFNMVYKEKMKTYNDIIRKASPHNFEIGNLVYVANPNNGKLDSNFRSEHHVILENTSINSFKLVNTKNGKIIHRNAKHLKHVPTQETNQGISDLIPEESQENLSSDSTRIEHLNSSDVQIPDDNSSNQDKDTSLNRPSSSRTGSTFNPVVSDRLDAEALHQLPPE
ncbi:hypothetical protein LAZ67_13000826, partial [Cordylochernes scorpioides]